MKGDCFEGDASTVLDDVADFAADEDLECSFVDPMLSSSYIAYKCSNRTWACSGRLSSAGQSWIFSKYERQSAGCKTR